MREREVRRRHEPPVIVEEHRGLDLNARQARCRPGREDAGEVGLERLIESSPVRPTICPGKHAILAEMAQAAMKHVGRKRSQFGPVHADRHVGHIALAVTQERALVFLVQDLSEPPFGHQRFDEGWQSAGQCLTNQRGIGALGGQPLPFMAIVRELAHRVAVPRDVEVERGAVRDGDGRTRIATQIAIGAFALAKPVIAPRKLPQGVGHGIGGAIFRDEPVRSCAPHFFRQGIGVLAAHPERFEQPLLWRRYVHGELAHAIVDDCLVNRRAHRRLGLDDFQPAQPRALIAATTDEQPTIGRRPQIDGACRAQIGGRIEIMGDAHGIFAEQRIQVALAIKVHAAEDGYEFAFTGLAMGACRINRFANEVECHNLSRMSDA